MQQNQLPPIPGEILAQAEKLIPMQAITQATRLVRQGHVSLSFTKGDPDTYFIVSGIIRDDRKHEAKVVYKKRLEGTPEGPLSSNCDCIHWTREKHCSHTASLLLSYLVNFAHGETGVDGLSHPPIPGSSGFSVNVMEYGTIVGGPHQFVGAPSNPTYSSLNYLLHNKKSIPFPVPESWTGKLVMELTSPEYFAQTEGEVLPVLRFKYRTPEGDLIPEITILESLYLFDWRRGLTFHLPSDLKSLMQKIRLQGSQLSINELIKMAGNLGLDQEAEIVVDGQVLAEVPCKDISCRVELAPTDKRTQLKMTLRFFDSAENMMPAPELLGACAFGGNGLLSSFKKKRDAQSFVADLVESLEQNLETYKKHLHLSGQRVRWQNLVTYSLEQEKVKLYDPRQKVLCIYDNKQLTEILVALYRNFGEGLLRFSTYDREMEEISYDLPAITVFQGLSQFYARVLPFGVSVFYDRNEISRWSSRIRFERRASSTKWFDLEMNVDAADLEVIENIDMDNGIALTNKGLILLTKEQKDMMRFMKRYVDLDNQGKMQVPTEGAEGEENGPLHKFLLPFNRARIFELFELRKLGIHGALTEEEIALCERLATLEKMPEYPLPPTMVDVLRPYQKIGYNWLRFLWENKLGACLADDMGLGKTLQAISFITSVYDQVDRILIVCPVTILLNWEKEFKKFSPNIDVHVYHGGERKLPDNTKIIITSYGVMKKEADETFKDIPFDVLILDEVQHLKNIRSLGAYAARKLKADFRICLTGTPVENDLAEFYNILDLSIPGVWGDLQILRTSSTSQTRMVARKTAAPFILRRTKSQVLTELPPKIENTIPLTFTDGERQEYVRSLMQVKKRIEQAPSKKKYGEILRGLLELRQKCLWQNHPGQGEHHFKHVDSSKIEFLVETLEQVLEEGHQALVFSQFTTYLDIIQNILREKHWKLARIDGSQSIKKRQEQVDLFQEGKCPVFLISLKAGGVGLNLTAASYVFVMDPWWNPAVEQQAIDRAHRIGQKNTLTVYRPVIKDSVEEKVLELQEMKRELFRDLLPEDDETIFTGKLSMRDFEMLLN
jgi:superfamily II DNA or RNA helicase